MKRVSAIRPIVAVLGGAIFSLVFPPVDFAPAVLVGLAIWCWLIRGPHPIAYSAIFWATAYGTTSYWLFRSGFLALAGIIAGHAFYGFVVALILVAVTRAGTMPWWLPAPLLAFAEIIRSYWPFGGFPWAEVGDAWHDVAWVRNVGKLGGTPLLTFLTVLVVAALVEVYICWSRRKNIAVVAATTSIGIIATTISLSVFLPSFVQNAGTLRIAMLQADDVSGDIPASESKTNLFTEKHLALSQKLKGKYDLIVFPEGTFGVQDPRKPGTLRRSLQDLAQSHDSFVLASALIPRGNGLVSNGMVLFKPDGSVAGSYDKRKLVPFGEYVPLRWMFSWVPNLENQTPSDYVRGNDAGLFDIRGSTIGTLICYEVAFSRLVNQEISKGANIVVTGSDNRTFARTAEPKQILAETQMQAVTTGRPMVLATLSGISAVVDNNGNLVDTTKEFTPTILSADITLTSGLTPYVRTGDWVIFLVSAFCLIGIGVRRWSVGLRNGSMPTGN